jgi:hypothetical protein
MAPSVQDSAGKGNINYVLRFEKFTQFERASAGANQFSQCTWIKLTQLNWFREPYDFDFPSVRTVRLCCHRELVCTARRSGSTIVTVRCGIRFAGILSPDHVHSTITSCHQTPTYQSAPVSRNGWCP